MIAWVLYDIQDNKARTKVAKYCKQAGLYRVQKSVFLGTLTAHERDELELKITSQLEEAVDSVYIFPMSRNELQQTILLGQAFSKEMVSDEVKALFL